MQGGKRACTRYPHTLPSIVELYHGIMNKIRPKTMMIVDVLSNSSSSTAFSLIQIMGITEIVDVVSNVLDNIPWICTRQHCRDSIHTCRYS